MELAVTVTAVGALRGCLIVNKQAPHDAVSAAPNAKSQLTVISTTEAWESRRESRLGDGKRLYQIVTNNYEVIFVFTQGVLERQCTEHQGCRHQLLMPAPGTPSALSLSIQKDTPSWDGEQAHRWSFAGGTTTIAPTHVTRTPLIRA